jgi:hypothetical protein
MASVQRLTVKSEWGLTLELDGDAVDGQTLSPTHLNPVTQVYTPTSNPPASIYYADEFTGDSGTPTFSIDLTALTDVEGVSQDGTDLKLRELRIQTGADNSGVVTIGPGDSNGYDFAGTDVDVEVQAGGMLQLRFGDGLDDISETAKTLTLALSHGDTCSVELIIG